MTDAEVNQIVELINGADEGSCRCEGSDMKLVDRGGRKRRRLPSSIRPRESSMIDEARRSVNTVRLPGRTRIGERASAIEAEHIIVLGTAFRYLKFSAPPAVITSGQSMTDLASFDFDFVCIGRPYRKASHEIPPFA